MALRVLTTEERELLKSNDLFKEQCYWAVRDYAAYWAVHNGAALATEAERIKWAKDRQNGVAIENNDIGDQDVALKFLKFGKGIQVDLAAAPLSAEVIVAAWKVANKFEECASLYFDHLGESINMSKTGN
jgi:hypothetical protein